MKDDMTGGIPYGGADKKKKKNVFFICAIAYFVVPLHAKICVIKYEKVYSTSIGPCLQYADVGTERRSPYSGR